MRDLFDRIENPGLAPIVLVALVPIILAILDRRRARVVDWPAMRFLMLRSRARLRRWRMREAALIAARSLLLLAGALAILGPTARRSVEVSGGASAPRDVALVVDSSWSMTYRAEEDGPTALARAREGALRVLDGLRPRDRVALLLPAARDAEAAVALGDPARVREELEALAPGPRAFRILEALERAAGMLGADPERVREVWVFSDFAANAISEGGPERVERARGALRSRGPPVRAVWVDCGFPDPENRFVSAVEAPPLASGTDEETVFRAEIAGSAAPAGEETWRGGGETPVRLTADGIEVASVRATGLGSRPVSVEIPHRFEAAGPARVAVSIPEDGLAADDRRQLVLDILDRTEVLVVGPTARAGPDGRRGPLRDADYVDLALSPRLPRGPEPRTIFRARVEETVPAEDLSRYRVVAIAGIEKIDPEAAERIEGFVRRGGGLLLFAGSRFDPETWAERGYRGGRGFLPARPIAELGAASPSIRPRDIAISHPALAIFSGGEEGDLSLVEIRRWTRFRDPVPEAAVLARVDDASPWIIEARIGEGRVIALSTGAAPGDSELPLTPLFLPLVHRLARRLAAGEPASSSALVGDVLTLELPVEAAGAEAKAILPSGAERPAGIDVTGGRLVAQFFATDAPGFYEIRLEAPPLSRVFAVNLPAEESRLERLPEGEVARLAGALGVELLRGPNETPPLSERREESVPLRPWLLAAAIALALVDILLGRGFAKGAAPRLGASTLRVRGAPEVAG